MTGLLDVEPTSRVNYRQVGTRTGGAVIRGAVVRRQPPPDPSTRVASIPSKYETLLHRDPNERDAFGNRTQRFHASENDQPGPGSYYKPPSMVRTTTDSGSVSRLGYSTGFVSKSKRFSDRVRDVAPGPGQYQDTRVDRKFQNKKHGTSCFASTARSSNNDPFLSPSVTVPGPGEYNVSHTSSAIARNIARSAFTSKTARGFAPKLDVPAPGQYENPIELAQSIRGGNHSPQSVFKSTAKRLDSPIESLWTPGPGAYNAEDAETALRYDWIARAHTSAVFQKGNADRFGRVPTKRATEADVGPGSYNPGSPVSQEAGKPSQALASSTFRSSTSRGTLPGGQTQPRDVPGPAFYHPSSPDKRSHILNSNKKWL
ncbi:hypothetical protein Poli38472_012967 [Pythium oligandrum]|uniref:Uncharacterized protein n=1 Tax=Pythium oligandrum TaxID=41045 RepID=A0A8K1CJE9_PYTOL|nr:hypothetical protein Poli38472_012967 [Pythium oligandrum]|eukprot:TMW64345.1 hypothetical protein Poli38472_012967 [Pythium oligandrum]